MIRRFGPEVAGLPTLAVTVAERLGRPAPESAFGAEGALIDYRGEPGTIPTYSFSSLLAGKVDPERLRGRVVVIGATAPTLHDQHATPQGRELMSGPEVQANAIWTALHGFPLAAAPPWLDVLLILLAAASVPLLALRVRGTVAALAAPVLGLAYVAIAQFAFERGVVLAQAGPLAALALASVATVAVSSLVESVERQRIAAVNDLLEEQVRERTSELRATELEIIKRLGQAVESRDEETGEHIERIALLCHKLALAAQRVPGRPRRRGDPARRADLRDLRRLRRARVSPPVQDGVGRRGRARRDPRAQRQPFRPAAGRAVPRPRRRAATGPGNGPSSTPLGPSPVRGGGEGVLVGPIGRAPVSEGPSRSRPVSRILS